MAGHLPHGGPPRGVASHTWGSTMEPLLFLGFTFKPLVEGLHSWAFWVFGETPYLLGFPINRR